MAGRALLDAGFVVALLSRRDSHHRWAVAQTPRLGLPWGTCEAVLSEAFHLLGARGASGLSALLRRRAVVVAFDLANDLETRAKAHAKVLSLADACLVRMTEMRSDAVILTADTDFRIYRRHGRQVIPCVLPC